VNKNLGGFFRGLKPRGPEGALKDDKGSFNNNGNGNPQQARNEQLLSMFVPLALHAPADHGLRAQWEGIIEDQVRGRIFRANVKLLREELGQFVLNTALEHNLGVLETTLGGKVLTKSDVRKVLEVALTLQVMRLITFTYTLPRTLLNYVVGCSWRAPGNGRRDWEATTAGLALTMGIRNGS
jgi:hypothetical protein